MLNMIIKIMVLIATITFIIYLAFNGIVANITLNEIKDYIRSFGPLAPTIYILILTLIPLTLIPNSLIVISGGALFGIYYGTLYTIIGALFAATLAFSISRYFGSGVTEKLIKNKTEWFDSNAAKGGFIIIFLLRLIPIIPFDIISYGAGLSKIKYSEFISATLLGIIPGVLIYSNIGDKAVNVLSPKFWLAVGLLITLVLVSNLLKNKFTLKRIQDTSTNLFH